MASSIDEILSGDKPVVGWVEAYKRSGDVEVQGHLRTAPNETVAENLSSDLDGDGIPGFFDADADGDGLLEGVDMDGDGIVDGLAEALVDVTSWLP